MNTTGIWSEKGRLSGKPCVRNTRLSIAQVLAEVADGRALKEIAEDFNVDYDSIWGAWVDLVNELCLLKINSEHIMRKVGCTNYVKDTECPVSWILMNLLLDNVTPKQEAEKHAVDQEKIEGVLWNLAALLDRDWTNGPPEDISQAIKEGPT